MRIVAGKVADVKNRQAELTKFGKDLGKSKQAKQIITQIKNNWDSSKQGEMNDLRISMVLSAMISEML